MSFAGISLSSSKPMNPFSPSMEINCSTSLIFFSFPMELPSFLSKRLPFSSGQLLPFQQKSLQFSLPSPLFCLFNPLEQFPFILFQLFLTNPLVAILQDLLRVHSLRSE